MISLANTHKSMLYNREFNYTWSVGNFLSLRVRYASFLVIFFLCVVELVFFSGRAGLGWNLEAPPL